MTPDLPLTRDIVLVGGGHAHALVLRMWGMRPLPGARLTLIDPAPEAAYSGMLPGHVAGHYPRAALMIDLVRLARFAGARLVTARARGIDREARQVLLEGRPPVAYDVLSLDIGVTSDLPGLPGFADHGHAAKPLARFAEAWAAHLAAVAAGAPRAAAVIGGGVAGAELAMAMAHRLGPGAVSLIERTREPLPGLSAAARRRVLAAFARLGVALYAGAEPAAVSAEGVALADGRLVPAAFTAAAAGARPQPWLADTGLHLTDGFVTVGPTLASVTDPHVFAAGDCAHLAHAPRPKAGVFAVRAAPVLFRNLRAAVGVGRPRAFRPQRDYLKLVSLGGRRAVADRNGLAAAGSWVWRWKDRIDRRFMERLNRLPPMPDPPRPALVAEGAASGSQQPLCGGCAAKVGPGALAAALAALPAPARADIIAGAGGDAAVLDLGHGRRQMLSVDALRGFTSDWGLLARIAAVHALGDLWAAGARPQAALALVTLPRMSPALEAATLSEVLAAAAPVFAAEGAAIAGGHSAVGAELQIGFAVTGLADADPAPPAAARPGDALILTKPLGTGVILAAEMALAAPAAAVTAAIASMARPQGAAAALLAPQARGMTDVTGFGLAGHLLRLLDAAGLCARLELDALPVLAGAEALLARGIRSTLHAANAAHAGPRCRLPAGPRAELLHDPQTAGGLLAIVPAEAAADLVAAIRAGGLAAAAVIGRLEPGPPAILA
jgi:selenide,water dikinase